MLFMCSAKRRVMKPRIPKPTPTAHFLIMLLSLLIRLRGPEVEICLCFLVVLCWLVGSRGWIIFFELCVAVASRLSGVDHLGIIFVARIVVLAAAAVRVRIS